MLNREKYEKEILDIVCSGDNVAIINGTPTYCKSISCAQCDLDHRNRCKEGLKEWANSKYMPIDWTKIAVDTPVLTSNNNKDWFKNYFAKYKDGKVFTYVNGKTSWSIYENELNSWKYAKLAK